MGDRLSLVIYDGPNTMPFVANSSDWLTGHTQLGDYHHSIARIGWFNVVNELASIARILRQLSSLFAPRIVYLGRPVAHAATTLSGNSICDSIMDFRSIATFDSMISAAGRTYTLRAMAILRTTPGRQTG